jgi:SAM-dependent methyltransferase
MDEAARPIAPKVEDQIDWGGVGRVLDLGGGPGTYALAFLKKCPDLKVFLFDLPRTLRISRDILKKMGKLGLFEILEGDCAEDDLGGPYDLVWVSHLMHAHSEAWIIKVLKKIHASASLGGRVIIHDYLQDEDKTGPLEACLFSVHMLAVTQEGRCYSFGEYSRMLQEAGFQKASLTLGPAPGVGLIVARKP